jgi:hypothetical protein
MSGKKLSKKIKKFKKKSPWPRTLYKIGLLTKSFSVFLTGLSLIILAILSLDSKISVEEIFQLIVYSWAGRLLIFLLGLSLIAYQAVELLHKAGGAEKKIKKL